MCHMRKIILASHGELSKGMLNSLNMIVGEEMTKNVFTYSLYPGESPVTFANDLREQMEQNVEDEYVIVADVLGGSVHMALSQVVNNLHNVILFSGMNMAMLLELIVCPQTKIDISVADRIKTSGAEGITYLTGEAMFNTEEEDF